MTARLVLLALLAAAAAGAQSSGIRTYCNPIDIDYRYNWEQMSQRISYRSGADPVIVNYKGEYYLFETVAGGYWRSRDLGRWDLYWGSSNVYPVYGIELDPARRLAYKDGARPTKLLYLHPERHGWERFGQDHRDTIRPYVEGAWMTKHRGRYYLQYAAPGTEYNVYANGTYVGDRPL